MITVVMLSTRTLSCLVLCLCASLPCVAQHLAPVMRLSADESMRAKQLVQSLGAAKERSAKAEVAWEQFHQTYQAAHPNVPGLRFTDDFSLAFALMSSSVDEVRQVTTIELTAEEKRKLDSLSRGDRERAITEAGRKELAGLSTSAHGRSCWKFKHGVRSDRGTGQ
jgi:hypothetical protein